MKPTKADLALLPAIHRWRRAYRAMAAHYPLSLGKPTPAEDEAFRELASAKANLVVELILQESKREEALKDRAKRRKKR